MQKLASRMTSRRPLPMGQVGTPAQTSPRNCTALCPLHIEHDALRDTRRGTITVEDVAR